MRTFLEDIGKRIGETAEIVGNRANEALEIQKLKSQIRALERGNADDLAELGEMIYAQFKDGSQLSEEAQSLCEAIRDREESIEDCRQQISDVRGDCRCEVCGKSVSRDMAYCPYCGEKFQREEPGDSDVVDEAVQFAGDVAEKAAETAEKISDAVMDAAGKVMDTAQSAVDEAAKAAQDEVAEAAEAVKEEAPDTAQSVKEEAPEGAGAEAAEETEDGKEKNASV